MRVTFSVEPLLPLASAQWLNTEHLFLPYTQGCWVLRMNMVQPPVGDRPAPDWLCSWLYRTLIAGMEGAGLSQLRLRLQALLLAVTCSLARMGGVMISGILNLEGAEVC